MVVILTRRVARLIVRQRLPVLSTVTTQAPEVTVAITPPAQAAVRMVVADVQAVVRRAVPLVRRMFIAATLRLRGRVI